MRIKQTDLRQFGIIKVNGKWKPLFSAVTEEGVMGVGSYLDITHVYYFLNCNDLNELTMDLKAGLDRNKMEMLRTGFDGYADSFPAYMI